MRIMIRSKNPPTPAPTTAGRRVKPPLSLVDRGTFAGTLRMGAFEWVEVVFITGVVREGDDDTSDIEEEVVVVDIGDGLVVLKAIPDPESDVNSVVGRMATCKYHGEKYSVVYVFVENTTLTNIAIVSRVPTPADTFSGKVTVAS